MVVVYVCIMHFHGPYSPPSSPQKAVLSADLRLNEPRYPKLQSIMGAKRKPLTETTLKALGIDATPTQGEWEGRWEKIGDDERRLEKLRRTRQEQKRRETTRKADLLLFLINAQRSSKSPRRPCALAARR